MTAVETAFVGVTEQAALAAAQTMGFGDGRLSDRRAVEAMRAGLAELPISGRVVIGEGERDDAPMLYIGEVVGGLTPDEADDDRLFELAVDPLEGTDLCAGGAAGSVTVLAAAEPGGLLHAPDLYMEKIVVGPTARGTIHLDAPVPENLRNIARAFGRSVSDLTIVVLERERHRQLVADIRSAGARIRLIPDGDLAAGISAAVRGTGVHAVMGIGGAPEGVIKAAAMRCLGGEIQGRLLAPDQASRDRLAALGIDDPDRLYGTTDLAPGDHIVFSCTGVTESELLRGVRFFGGGVRTSSLYMSLRERTIRFVDTIHRDDLTTPVLFR